MHAGANEGLISLRLSCPNNGGINGETVTFKFDVLPADADVQAAAERYAAMTQEQAHAPADTD